MRANPPRFNGSNIIQTIREMVNSMANNKNNISMETLLKYGKLWEKGEYKRIYFNRGLLMVTMGIEVEFYKTGNLASCHISDERISNCKGKKLMARLDNVKCFYDLVKSEFVCDDAEILESVEEWFNSRGSRFKI
jgi:hypothetical protein